MVFRSGCKVESFVLRHVFPTTKCEAQDLFRLLTVRYAIRVGDPHNPVVFVNSVRSHRYNFLRAHMGLRS